MIRCLPCFVLAAAAATIPVTCPADTPPFDVDRLDTKLAEVLDEWPAPGAAIAVVYRGELVFAKGYGVKRIGEPDPVTPDSLFAIGSNTKAFTAALLGTLVDEGRLRWDDPVIDHLPKFRLADPFLTHAVSVRDLLTHQTGLPKYGGDHLWIGGDVSRRDILDRLRYLKPATGLRQKVQYNNLMWMVAGEVYRAISGERWADGVRARLFEPLGMRNSLALVGDLDIEAGADVAWPHEERNGSLESLDYENIDVIAAAGSILSSATDMTRWLAMHLDDGELDGVRILSADTVSEMHAVSTNAALDDEIEILSDADWFGYGLGWRVFEYKQQRILRHGGSITGMKAQVGMIPALDVGIVALANFAPGNLREALLMTVLDEVLGGERIDWSARFAQIDREAREKARESETRLLETRVSGTQPSRPLADYAGTYFSFLSGDTDIGITDAGLRFQYNQRHSGLLRHWHYDVFRIQWDEPLYDAPRTALIRFDAGIEGGIESLTLQLYSDTVTFGRTDRP